MSPHVTTGSLFLTQRYDGTVSRQPSVVVLWWKRSNAILILFWTKKIFQEAKEPLFIFLRERTRGLICNLPQNKWYRWWCLALSVACGFTTGERLQFLPLQCGEQVPSKTERVASRVGDLRAKARRPGASRARAHRRLKLRAMIISGWKSSIYSPHHNVDRYVYLGKARMVGLRRKVEISRK